MSTRLIVWTSLGLGGCVTLLICGLSDNWPGFVVGVISATVATFMLGSGLFMRWPRI